jgi:hypothetical protein
MSSTSDGDNQLQMLNRAFDRVLERLNMKPVLPKTETSGYIPKENDTLEKIAADFPEFFGTT